MMIPALRGRPHPERLQHPEGATTTTTTNNNDDNNNVIM